MKEEVWKDVPEYESIYMVSDLGRVKSLDRVIQRSTSPFTVKGAILTGWVEIGGYRVFELRKDKKSKIYKLHQLVAMAFLNHTPSGMEKVVNHIDGNKLNNHLSNLEIVTHRDNMSTCYRKNESKYSSSYIGVSWNSREQMWESRIRVFGKNMFLGYFYIEEDARDAYQEALMNIDSPEYFESLKPIYTSIYKNIWFDKSTNKWGAQWFVNKKTKHIGYYDTEQEAYDAQQQYLKDNNIESL